MFIVFTLNSSHNDLSLKLALFNITFVVNKGIRMKKVWFKHAREIHKTLGYILAIQIFLWLLGGFVMSAIPLEKVHGKHLANKSLENPFKQKDYKASLDTILSAHNNLNKVTFGFFLNDPLYIVSADTKQHVYNANNGLLFTAPALEEIKQQAAKHYIGSGDFKSINMIDMAPAEAGFRKNMWVVTYDDWIDSTLYLSQDTGQVLTVRSDLWRIFDFFWMLHIMDYENGEDFNNPLLIGFSFSAVLFCLSGITLIFQNLRLRRFRIKPKTKE